MTGFRSCVALMLPGGILLLVPLAWAVGAWEWQGRPTTNIVKAEGGLSSTSGRNRLRAVFVIHRHGAREPMPSVNRSSICGRRCGQLNAFGAAMLQSLGEAVTARYGRNLSIEYDPRHATTSSSSDVDRTLQSADNFIWGRFAAGIVSNHTVVAPVVHTVPIGIDRQLLVWTGWPSLVAWGNATWDEFQTWMLCVAVGAVFVLPDDVQQRCAIDLPYVVDPASFAQAAAMDVAPPVGLLLAVGEEMGLGEECSLARPALWFQCALDLQDLWESRMAAGNLPMYPSLSALGDSLNRLVVLYNVYSFWGYPEESIAMASRRQDGFLAVSFPPVSAFLDDVGAKGQYLLRDMVERVEALPVIDAGGSPVTVLHEYSGHDVTIMPVAEALGATELIRPKYGAALIVEVWQHLPRDATAWWRLDDGNASVGVNCTMKAFYGEPPQLPSNNAGRPPLPVDYEYSFVPLAVLCDAPRDGGGGVARTTTCGWDDWVSTLTKGRFGRVDDPACFLSTSVLAKMNCTAEEGPPPSGSVCRQWRQACPLRACQTGVGPSAARRASDRLLDPTTFACVSGRAGDAASQSAVTLGVVSGAVGLIAGAVVSAVFLVLRREVVDARQRALLN